MTGGDPRRRLPAIHALLDRPAVRALAAHAPAPLVATAARQAVERARTGDALPPDDAGWWDAAVAAELARLERPSLRRVLNATGVVLHTNLGRAPLPPAALAAIAATAGGFATLEYDLDAGTRGSRHTHAIPLLRELTGAEDAMVVNNGAAALVLALAATAAGREAIVSRGELVEIGGSFRVPDIMATSGARLVEVGTTNRTHAADYAGAIGPATGALVKVHRANFALAGYTASVAAGALVPLAAAAGVPVIHDLGSGLLMDLAPFGLSGEPTAREAVAEGAHLVLMSGDKLLGGPQAGLLVGAAAWIARCRAHPLARALRVDKLTLAALEATLALYRDPEAARRTIPALAMLTTPVETIVARAHALADGVGRDRVAVRGSAATVGGGAFPTATIPSAALVPVGEATVLEARLRRSAVPVIGRIADGRVWLDLRGILPDEDALLAAQLREVLA